MSTRYQAKRNAKKYNRRTSRRYKNSSHTFNIFPFFLLILLGVGVFLFVDETAKAQVLDLIESNEITKQVATEVMARIEKLTTDKGVEEKNQLIETTVATQANVARIIAYTLGGQEQMEAYLANEKWYSPYYTYLTDEGYTGLLEEKAALSPMTYEQTEKILRHILGDSFKIQLTSDAFDKTSQMPLKEFLTTYEQAMSYVGGAVTPSYETLSILATPTTQTQLGAWHVATDKGIYHFEGLILDPYKDYTIKAMVVDHEILGIMEVMSNETTINQAKIYEVNQEGVWLAVDDTLLYYTQKNLFEATDVGETYTIFLKNGAITKKEIASGTTLMEEDSDVVLRVADTYVEFLKAGRLPYENLEVVDISGTNNWKTLAQVATGTKVSYETEKGQLTLLMILEKNVLDSVRVVVTEDGFFTYTHEDVAIKADSDYYIEAGEKTFLVASGMTWRAKEYDWGENEKIKITPTTSTGLQLLSIERQGKNPVYKGNLEIYKEKDGSYMIVNEVAMNDYLAGVIPSEMPAQYGLEAAKVQAVAARSYAINHQTNSKFAKYGAQLDDTTASQVYNNVEPTEMAYEAAQTTDGLVMVVNDKVISGNFFSTSAGYTANYGETWADGEIFPTNTPTYLVANQQYIDDLLDVDWDLSKEADAYEFLTQAPEDLDAFDNHSAWFRWQLKLSGNEMTTIINANLEKISNQYPNLVKVKRGEDEWETEKVTELGTVKNLEVKKRGEGGNVMELIIEGTENTVKVATEYVIRTLLSPTQKEAGKEAIVLTRTNGSDVENMEMLPSAFFVMDINYTEADTLKNICFYGGGFGHGVGMSQEGVKGMVERGYSFEKILSHYYKDVEILNYPFL
jgi:stage II sporulation protein D